MIAGAIIAGGAAARLGGAAKGALPVEGAATIIQRLIDQFHRAGVADVLIVANDPAPYRDCGVRIIGDRRTGLGPLAGIEAALAELADRAEATVLAPCDTPRYGAAEMIALIDAHRTGDAPVVVAQTGGFFWHPLCSVVHNGCLDRVSAALDGGERSVKRLWQSLGARPVEFADDGPFVNINTPEDWQRFQSEQG